MHRDVVYEYPEGTEQLAYTDKCAVQGFYIHKKVFTMQGHPEFNEEIMKEILSVRRKMGVFDEEMFTDAMERAGKHQDGVVIAKAFLKFLLD
jgi:GMP synthase-like glutamine amidotransferase